MDGIHIHGNSRRGRIANLKGTTNDDLVALNADDAGIFEMCRGPIEDIAVDGIWSKDGYTAVRLLSAGPPVRRIRLANIFGTYRAVSFTNHKVHPGSESAFEHISIRGLFCAKSGMGMRYDPAKPGRSLYSLIWIDAPAVVNGLAIADLHRTESLWPSPTIFVEAGAIVKGFQIHQATILNRTPGPLDLLVNRGTIEHLCLSEVRVEACAGPARRSGPQQRQDPGPGLSTGVSRKRRGGGPGETEQARGPVAYRPQRTSRVAEPMLIITHRHLESSRRVMEQGREAIGKR